MVDGERPRVPKKATNRMTFLAVMGEGERSNSVAKRVYHSRQLHRPFRRMVPSQPPQIVGTLSPG